MKGGYFLILFLPEDFHVKTKGRNFFLRAGYYVYVGSAMNSLEGRIARHFRKEKRPHWHIDYLLMQAELLRAYLVPSEKRIEEELSRGVAEFGEPVPGFGASDVSVGTNLYRFDEPPDEKIKEILRRLGLKWMVVEKI
ncbi:GIY-YIG nuclease family protein [Pyrococcus yayanosii]|uniref:GIY-YIG domain-containing protein n=1 Tax=Pyrococcus yayanosii (strain CH1 / JCM 16557) TaxID=529709 RepID=F8AI67_PYRYC|nr:DUF123 domain-containing protein [Pyrococcus yayanosii]AEH24294.1 hypothetical protein PYCH_06060 [Pyrococcus yayanosii CH1]